jgi:SAM-dependent methyltransferase
VQDPYDAIAPFYDRAVGEGGEDILLYEALARRHGGPVLEIGAGTGRVAVPLAAAGFEVIAVEPSAAMRERGAARAARAGVTLTWIPSPFDCAEETPACGLVLCALDSFLHFTSAESQLAALARARDCLVPGGVLALDLPTLASWSDWQPGVRSLELLWTERDPATGVTTAHFTSFQMDPSAQTRHVRHVFEESDANGSVRRWHAGYDLRFVGRFELELLLRAARLRPVGIHGDYELGPLTDTSERMIVLAGRAGAKR